METGEPKWRMPCVVWTRLSPVICEHCCFWVISYAPGMGFSGFLFRRPPAVTDFRHGESDFRSGLGKLGARQDQWGTGNHCPPKGKGRAGPLYKNILLPRLPWSWSVPSWRILEEEKPWHYNFKDGYWCEWCELKFFWWLGLISIKASGGILGPICTLRACFRQSEKSLSLQVRQTWGSALDVAWTEEFGEDGGRQ